MYPIHATIDDERAKTMKKIRKVIETNAQRLRVPMQMHNKSAFRAAYVCCYRPAQATTCTVPTEIQCVPSHLPALRLTRTLAGLILG